MQLIYFSFFILKTPVFLLAFIGIESCIKFVVKQYLLAVLPLKAVKTERLKMLFE